MEELNCAENLNKSGKVEGGARERDLQVHKHVQGTSPMSIEWTRKTKRGERLGRACLGEEVSGFLLREAIERVDHIEELTTTHSNKNISSLMREKEG